jgi:hypothetical protein
MMRLFSKLLFCAAIFTSQASYAGNLWKQIDVEAAPMKLQLMHPQRFLVYTLDEPTLRLQLANAGVVPGEGIILVLPMADGTLRNFKIWETSLMPADLAARYPEIRSFTGEATDDRTVTAKLDYTPYGFDAMIFDGDNTSFIDPFDNFHDGFYMAHYKRDETRAFTERMKCEVSSEHANLNGEQSIYLPPSSIKKARTTNGWNLRTYRLALSADHFYCQAATGLPTPTIAQSLAKMTISMNRINGVYNREFSVQMNFCSKEDTLIWPTNTGSINGNDPFNTINSSGSSCLGANQTQCTNRVGSANYDLGHVFTTGGGGISSLGVVCNSSQKAKSVTGSPSPVGDGFDIDYVAHEMGHEFGAEHPFNDNTNGSCGTNAVSSVAYEPGSGSTIMAYAGICSPDDIQPHSDAYFHAASLGQITAKLNGSENTCAVITSTGNKLVNLPLFSAAYTIPYKTPFELSGPVAVDSVADTSNTYCWEQWNKGDFNTTLLTTHLYGPIFRSYNPVNNPTRIFPKLSMVLAGSLSNAGVENNQGEKAADTARYLTFRMTVRDIIAGNGSITFPDDTIHLDVVSTGATNGYAGFKVTSQATAGLSFPGGAAQSITWNVVGTDVAPVNAANVTIYMSRDGGNTWADSLGTFPNTGTAAVNLPNPTATIAGARFKVKGTGNVFFNVNAKNFAVTHNSSVGVAVAEPTTAVKVFPNPASNLLHIQADGRDVAVAIYNTVGQKMYDGTINASGEVSVAAWARGIYYLHLTDKNNGEVIVKSVVLE